MDLIKAKSQHINQCEIEIMLLHGLSHWFLCCLLIKTRVSDCEKGLRLKGGF